MKLVAALAASALAVSSVFAGASEARAEYRKCGRLAGFNVCAVDRKYIDSLSLKWSDGGYTHIAVRCATRTFDTTLGARYITYSQAKAITGAWCFG